MTDLIITYPPSGLCPVQADGTYRGRLWYFRSRHRTMEIHVAPEGSQDVFDRAAWRYHEVVDPDPNGHAAGYADSKDCIAFIERAIKLHPDFK